MEELKELVEEFEEAITKPAIISLVEAVTKQAIDQYGVALKNLANR
jgi:hypothetical protein